MTRKELIEKIMAAAEPVYGEREAAAIARLVTEKRYGLSRADTALSPLSEIIPGDGFEQLLADIAAARPVQYILGVADFYGLELEVGEGVLIPRPETEELVRLVVRNYELSKSSRARSTQSRIMNGLLNILDIGTGSGAIAIALAKNLPQARVTAIDISPDALEYARRNNEKYSAGVAFHETDILAPEKSPLFTLHSSPFANYDVIVSNPPYIPASERAAMARNVTGYEPCGALFVPDDAPLLFYRAIAKFARRALVEKSGSLYFEIHEAMGDAVRDMLADEGFTEIEIHEDINSKPRIIKCNR